MSNVNMREFVEALCGASILGSLMFVCLFASVLFE